MPTKHPRIAVTCDAKLADALERVEAMGGMAHLHRARIVHDLALRGAAVVVQEEAARDQALRRLAERSTQSNGPFDREVLARIDEEAWGIASDPE